MTKHILTLIFSLFAIVATAGPLANSIKAGKEVVAHDNARQYAAKEYSESMMHNVSIDCTKADFLNLVHISESVVYDCGINKFFPAIDYVSE